MSGMYTTRDMLRKGGQPVGLNRRRVLASSRAFAAKFAALMERERISAAELARRLGYACSSSVGHIIAARIAFPIPRAEEFAEALGLHGDEREQFLDDAALSTLPPRAYALVERLQATCPHPSTRGSDGQELGAPPPTPPSPDEHPTTQEN